MKINFLEKAIENLRINFLNRKNSPSLTFSNKKIDKSTQYNNYGLGFNEVERLTTLVIKEQLPKMIEVEAKRVFEDRISDFKKTIEPMVQQLKESEIKQLIEPDTQFMLREAANTSGRRTEKDIRSVLAHLVVKRIKSDSICPGESIKDIVFNEAVTTVGKMTSDQLKIITLCYILKYTKRLGVSNWDNINDIFEKSIKPFIDFKNTQTEFQHIEYVGAGSISALGSDFCDSFSKEYGFVFNKDISKEKIESIDMDINIKNNIFLIENEIYKFKFDTKNILDKFLDDNNILDSVKNEIIKIWNESRLSKQEVENIIKEKNDTAKKLLDLWKNSSLSRLLLTSVGIAIAATNYEQTTGDPLNIDIWIK
ncbi:MAG: hypothetical protein PHS45_04395 [Bacilli bacterium]|nr:hypothetical protein [Bacilli bacterium]